jgi:hypothetical protein
MRDVRLLIHECRLYGEREIPGGSVRKGTPGSESNDQRIRPTAAVKISRSLQTPRNLPLSLLVLRPGSLRKRARGRIFSSEASPECLRVGPLAQQLTEHKRQNAPVTVVIHLNGRVDAKFDWLFNNGAILACDAQGHVLTRHGIIGQTEHVGELCAVKTQGLSGDSLRELKWEDAHCNKV